MSSPRFIAVNFKGDVLHVRVDRITAVAPMTPDQAYLWIDGLCADGQPFTVQTSATAILAEIATTDDRSLPPSPSRTSVT